MLADIPPELHVSVLDARGVPHDAVVVTADLSRNAHDLGFPVFEDAEVAYVAKPFAPPAGSLVIRRGGRKSVRRVAAVSDNAAFCAITLGGEL